VAEVGELLAAMHALPTAGLAGELESDWPTFVQQRIEGCMARHRAQGAPGHLIEQIPEFLARAAPLYPADLRYALVTGDVHDYHLLVDGQHLVGLFDFDDARLGHADYDLAATALFLRDTRTLLAAYGADPPQGRLLAYTLLHRYRELRWVLEEFVGHTPATLDELASALYGLS